MGDSRTLNTVKNAFWGNVGNALQVFLHFISRTIFIKTIGIDYLGINGLFTNVLGMMSLAEMGIGTAINFNLYKPVSSGNIEKIKSLMSLYKKAYRIIALVVTLVGLAIMPCLQYIIKDINTIDNNIYTYYLIFLFNTVSTYMVSYKQVLVNAEQKNYIISNFNSIFNIIISFFQIVVMLTIKKYLMYLIVVALLQFVQKVSLNIYINSKYTYLKEKNVEKLSSKDKEQIKKNVFALLIHKLGEISVHQTDNIIISTFINVAVVGKISNYNLVITSVVGFITIIFTSFTAGLGNLIATENATKQKEVFEIYQFIGFWLYGFSGICFYTLLQRFIVLWIGTEYVISDLVLLLLVVSHYFTGERVIVNNMKTAGGIFSEDKYVSLLQGIINLVVSIVLVKKYGIAGVYIGTVVSGVFVNIVRPIILYKKMFNASAYNFFKKSLIYFLVTVATGCTIVIIEKNLLREYTIINFIILALIDVVLINLIFSLFFSKSKQFSEFKRRVNLFLKPKKGKNK